MALCAIDDMEALLQNNITNPVDPMALTILDLASLAIEAEVGRDLEAVALTGIVRTMRLGNNGVLLTDHWPLASIESVTEDGELLVLDTDYFEDLELGTITRITGTTNPFVIAWDAGPSSIVLDYTPVTPGVARTECARLAADAFIGGANFAARASIAGGAMLALRQLTIGRWSGTAETGAGSGTTGVIVDELARTRLSVIVDRRP